MTLDNLTATALFSQFPEPILLIKVDGTIVAANQLALELFEMESEVAGLNVVDLLTQPERARLDPLAWMERWATSPHAPETDYVYLTCRTQRGNEKQLNVRVSRLAEDEVFYLVVLRDVSHSESRLRAERLAHRIAARVLALSADAVVTTDDSFLVSSFNASAERLFQYSAAEVLGKPLNALIPKRSRPQHEQLMQKFALEKEPSRLMGERAVISALTKDGRELPMEASITRLTVENHTVYCAHLRDMRSRLASEAALKESQAQFRELFEYVDQAMAMLSADGLVQAMNPAALRLLTDEDDVIGHKFARLPWWSNDPESTRETLEQALQMCREGNLFRTEANIVIEDRTLVLDVCMRPVSRDGQVFSILVEAHEIHA